MGLHEHEIPIRVRYCETDAMGFLHHANFLCYFEMGRTELFRAQGGDYRKMEEGGHFFVVVEMNVKYRSPARFVVARRGAYCFETSGVWIDADEFERETQAGLAAFDQGFFEPAAAHLRRGAAAGVRVRAFVLRLSSRCRGGCDRGLAATPGDGIPSGTRVARDGQAGRICVASSFGGGIAAIR